MKTYLLLLLLITTGFTALAQPDKYANSYLCRNGKIHFFSSTPIEDIEATSNNTICSMNTETQKVYAKVQINTFRFPKKLMEEHFNENYMESEDYPYAILDAIILEKIDYSKDGTYDVTLKGTLEMHGVKLSREIKGKLIVKNGQPVTATANFDVKLVDHKIKVPKALMVNIAEIIKVDIAFIFEKYQKS